ncbi:CU044_5270 family protein [Nonomuraea sp. KM88]|uniref:CU044_5270 family protein n=1 Tax=Nonomuraea sp. KM88 TaxID=3457427 RepID=UPI003FCC3E55
MDDELRPLATVLAKPEPPREVELRSRNRLLARMGESPRRRYGWLLPGFGMAAAAAVIALVVGVAVVGTTSAPGSGREVLLVAATSAESAPEGSGKYWYTRAEAEGSDLVVENWVSRDGGRWSKGTPANPHEVGPDRPQLFVLGDAELTWEELQALPADPGRLTTWIRETHEREELTPAAAEELEDLGMTAADQERFAVVHRLAALITSMPAPSDVRAAAFRALADLPGVENRGAVEGGEALSIPTKVGEINLVVDPETSRVSRANVVQGNDGSSLGSRSSYRLTAEWTDHLPR